MTVNPTLTRELRSLRQYDDAELFKLLESYEPTGEQLKELKQQGREDGYHARPNRYLRNRTSRVGLAYNVGYRLGALAADEADGMTCVEG